MAGLIDADGGLDFGTGLAWLTSGIGQAGLVITTSTSAAALFLAEYGPYGMAMDFDDASIAIANSDGSLNYQSQGDFSSAGAPLGPLSKLTYTAPSVKLTERADGFLGFQAHNLYLNSAAPANQSVTTGMVTGATYAITLTGSVSITLSGAATGTITAGTTTFTAASGTLTCGSTSGSGTVHLRRTPSIDTYVATAGSQVYDLPYVYSGGVRTAALLEPASTNRNVFASTFGSWTLTAGVTRTPDTTVAPDGTTTADTLAFTSSAYLYTNNSTVSSTGTFPMTGSIWLKGTPGEKIGLRIANATAAVGSSVLITLTANWVRYTITADLSFTAGNSVAMGLETRSGVVPGTGSAVTVQAWGAQVEDGAAATSLIPTYGSAVLRAADTPNALLNLFPSIGTAYTIYAKYKPQSASVATTAIRLDDTTTNELVSLGNNASGQGLATVTDGGASQAAITSGTITESTFHRVAASVEANNVRLVVNGGAEVQDTSVTLPTLTRLLLTAGGGMELVQLAILPGTRTEAQLQALGA